jgi:hypothetical protein
MLEETFEEIDKHRIAEHEALSVHTKVDPDGEIISIKDLNLVVAGTINGEELPTMNPQHMKTFCIAVARTATYSQRHLPLKQKIKLIWVIFCQLFFNHMPVETEDPYIRVAEQWFRKQQVQIPAKQRIKLFFKRIKDMFIYTPDAEPIDTYGMPGFASYKKLSR